MSTKIYDGLKAKKNYSFLELEKINNEVFSKIKEIQEKKVFSYIVGRAEHFLDTKLFDKDYTLLGDYETESSLFTHFSTKLRHFQWSFLPEDRQLKRFFDFKASIVFFPIKGKILAMPLEGSLSSELKTLYQDYFSEYAYWDNVDIPENLTKQEWNLRKKDWQSAIGLDYVPANHGFIREFNYDEYEVLIRKYQNKTEFSKLLNKYKENKRKRINRVLTKRLIEEYQSKFLKGKKISKLNYQERDDLKEKLDSYCKSDTFKKKNKKYYEKYKDKFIDINYENLCKDKYKVKKDNKKNDVV